MAQMGPAAAIGMKQSPLAKVYPDVDWAVLFAKLAEMLKIEYDWSKKVAAIEARTLLVFADADSMRPAHIIEFRLARRRQAGCGAGRDRKAESAARNPARLYTLQHSQLANIYDDGEEVPGGAATEAVEGVVRRGVTALA